ncbi:hypothetical protein [Bradyrhizobium sp. RDI18]|uniref:hypothetical protein n=1 Tax=Bradyrhizobium sp. RDI18 TaxID=3367400 RepID=UPI00371CA23E
MVPHPLAALDQPEIANDAVRPAAHAGELRISKMIAHTRQHACSMHRRSISSILTAVESTSPGYESRQSVALLLRSPMRYSCAVRTGTRPSTARRSFMRSLGEIRLRKALKDLNADFLRERAFDPTHAIPEPDDFPLLLDIHWSPPNNDQREHNRNEIASHEFAAVSEVMKAKLQYRKVASARRRYR